MRTKNLVCVLCPLGCKIKVEIDDEGNIVDLSGNRCPRGKEYAEDEIKNPKRVVTTSVKVQGGELPLASVKTDGPIPKERIFDLMKMLKRITVSAPVKIGDVVVKNVFGTGVNVVITRSVEKKESNE